MSDKPKDKITESFCRSEFACRCNCGYDAIDERLVHRLQVIRDYIRVPATILSGCRCKKHNKKVGGEDGSYHLKGQACDFTMDFDEDLKDIANTFSNWSGGFHYYPEARFIHIDIGPRRRW